MLTYQIADDFALGVDAFWEMFFSEAYCRAMNDAIDLGWELVEFERTGSGLDESVRRIQKLTPKRDVPKLLRKFVDGAIAYTEHNVWRRKENLLTCRTVPNFMSEKITSEGDYRVEVLGPDRVRRTYDGRFECRVPIVGGKIESMLVAEVKESYRRAGEFTHTWIKQLDES